MSLGFSELAKVFNKNTFEEVLQGDFTYLRILNQNFFDGKNKTLGEFYESTYKALLKNYQNEYIFKNAIAQKIVIGKHKLADITFFNEFKVWNKYVDVVIVNGCTTAYEIKTEFDSYVRLSEQLSIYTQVFEFVNLVIPEKKINEDLLNTIPNNVGVVILTNRNTLSVKKEPISNLENLSQEMIFSCLRKQEYEDFVVKQFGSLPEVKPIYMRSHCLDMFRKSSKNELNLFFRKILKKRKSLSKYKKIIAEIPESLSNIALSEKLNSVEKIIKIANTELY
ncbi:MAG: sce7726 family protein [Bacilli bacterium]